MRSVDPAILRQLLRYEPETGRLFWLDRGIEWFTDFPNRSALAVCVTWNKRYAGREAFTSAGPWGHRFGSVLGVSLAAHRVVWALHHGQWPDKWLDHINGDAGDNRIENMREVDAEQNARNAGRSKRNKSGVTGVRWYPQVNKWHVQIGVNGRNQHIGKFDNFDEAVCARAEAEKQFGYHSNHGRAPQQMEK
jgi:hypothetical protein